MLPALFRPTRVVLALALVAATGAVAHAAERTRNGDRYWTAPDIADYPIAAIAMLPPATYDGSVENRRLVENAVGQALRGSGHRWASSFLIRDYLLKNGGDELLASVNASILEAPRVDSLQAPELSRILRTRGLLAVRVDQMERRELEVGQSGRPSTTIQLRAALVDSTGRLLWTAHSTETLEGQQQDADANVLGVKASGLNNQAIGATTSAPPFQEVLAKIGARWKEAFPKRALPDTTRRNP